MDPLLLVVASALVAYAVGSIPFGVLFARARGIDLRKVGSGNIGATNAARALGRKTGLLVFALDAAKGFVPVLLASRHLAPRLFAAGADWPAWSDWSVSVVGLAAFLGHLTTPWLRFRGGKGVATAFGVFLAISPVAALAAFALFALTYAATGLSSLGSLAAATAFVPALWVAGGSRAGLALALALWALIIVRHRGNIARLAGRRESRI